MFLVVGLQVSLRVLLENPQRNLQQWVSLLDGVPYRTLSKANLETIQRIKIVTAL